MKRLFLAFLIPCLVSAQAGAQLERSALVTRSQAMGGAFVSRADDPSGIFVNPAGITSAGLLSAYLDYDEPDGTRGSRETRLAGVVGVGKTRLGFGWYRLGESGASENLLVAGAARRLIEGTQGSFLSIGANASVGNIPKASCCGKNASSWSGVTGDIGLILRPLPVISFGYAIANISNEHASVEAGGEPWRRLERWGVSYSWQERIVLSFAQQHAAGRTTLHYGFSVKTAVPIELMAGFSDGNTTGGIRWLGGWFGAAVAFASDERRGVTWTCSVEMAFQGEKKEGAQ